MLLSLEHLRRAAALISYGSKQKQQEAYLSKATFANNPEQIEVVDRQGRFLSMEKSVRVSLRRYVDITNPRGRLERRSQAELSSADGCWIPLIDALYAYHGTTCYGAVYHTNAYLVGD